MKKNEEKRRLIIQENERLRISRDVHDSIGQLLVGTRLTLNVSKNKNDSLDEIDSLLDQMIKESRLIINNFGISLQENKNLKDAFENLGEKMARVFDGEIIIKWRGEQHMDDLSKATNIFRIYQEALSNAIKYSEAKKIIVWVKNQNGFNMEVTDDGVGFDIDQVNKGFGTTNMTERAHEIKSRLEIESALGKGTKVKLLTIT